MADVALDSSGTASNFANAVTTVSVTGITVGTGPDRVLVAVLHLQTVASSDRVVTWNGVPLTEVAFINTNRYTGIWRLVTPASGNLTLAASWTTTTDAVLGGVAFSNVDQTTPVVVAHNVTASGSDTTPTTGAVTSDAAGATVGAASAVLSATSTDTQTEVYRNNSSTNVTGALSYGLGGSANTHTWTLTGSNIWSVVGVHVQAVQAAAVPPFLTTVSSRWV